VENGYDTQSIVTMSVSLAGTRYEAGERAWPYYDDVLSRIGSIPGVLSVSATDSLPLAVDGFMGTAFRLDNAGPTSPLTTVVSVAPGYFRTMGGRVIFGREFLPADRSDDEPLAVINEQLARALGNPSTLVGRSLTAERWPVMRIVGVVQGMRYGGPAYAPGPQVFRLSRAPRAFTIVAKVAGPARDRLAVVRDTMQSVDPLVPVFDVRTMDDRLDATLARPRFYVTAVGFFGALALLLAIVGVYGAVSYAVWQRTREMGIRLALGTTPARLRRVMLRQMLATVSLGTMAGVGLSLGLGRYLQSLLQGADAAPMLTSALALSGTVLVAAAATWAATRHIAHLDIMDVLRAESAD